MTHLASHIRRSLADWIEAGFPDTATVEHDYVRTEVSPEEMLRRFISPVTCSDRLPLELTAAIVEHLGISGRPVLSYATAAFLLLAQAPRRRPCRHSPQRCSRPSRR